MPGVSLCLAPHVLSSCRACRGALTAPRAAAWAFWIFIAASPLLLTLVLLSLYVAYAMGHSAGARGIDFVGKRHWEVLGAWWTVNVSHRSEASLLAQLSAMWGTPLHFISEEQGVMVALATPFVASVFGIFKGLPTRSRRLRS